MGFISNRFRGLWRDADFMKFWTGETLSLLGSQITTLAIPLTAAVTLNATPAQMGFLNASSLAPYLLLTLFAGVWIDRSRRRPILLGANLGRAALLAFIPLSFVFGFLQMEYLYVLVFLTGVLTVFFDLAYQSYLPSLVGRDQLVEGNSKLQISASMAQISGQGFAGVLISLLTAPIAILIDAISFLVSTMFIFFIRKKEPKATVQVTNKSIWREMASGLKIVFTNPYLRAIACEASTYNIFSQVTTAVLILYLVRELHIEASLLGIIMSMGSVGALLGSLVADSIKKNFRVGSIIIGSMFLACASPLLIPVASGSLYIVISILVVSFLLSGIGLVISNIYVISLRQSLIPQHLLGRMNASYRFVVAGVTPIGSLLGGTLGTYLGLHLTLIIGALGTLSAVLWIIFSPIAKLKEMPGVSQEFEENNRTMATNSSATS